RANRNKGGEGSLLMPHLLIAGKLHPAGLAVLEAAGGVTYDYVEEVSEHSYAPMIGKADALVIRTQPLSAETLAKAERLKLVSRRHLLILGFGRIGRHLAQMALAFGMEVRAYDPFLERHGWPAGPVLPAASLEEGLAWANVISVNIPKASRPVLGAAELAKVR